jgi:hypothetical protein
VRFTPRAVFRTPASARPKPIKVIVDDLPFPNPRTAYNARWQKVFCPTLLSWASTFNDPYATNTLLEEESVVEMWDIIYPDINLDKDERREIGSKLVYLVCLIICYHDGESVNISRLETFSMTGVLQSGQVP